MLLFISAHIHSLSYIRIICLLVFKSSEAILLLHLWKELPSDQSAQSAPQAPHGGSTVQLRSVQQALYDIGQPEATPAGSQRREAVPVRPLRQSFLRPHCQDAPPRDARHREGQQVSTLRQMLQPGSNVFQSV